MEQNLCKENNHIKCSGYHCSCECHALKNKMKEQKEMEQLSILKEISLVLGFKDICNGYGAFREEQQNKPQEQSCNPIGGCNAVKKPDDSWDKVYCDKHNPSKPQEQEEWVKKLDKLWSDMDYEGVEYDTCCHRIETVKFFIRSLLLTQKAEAMAELKEKIIKKLDKIKVGIKPYAIKGPNEKFNAGCYQAISEAIEIVKKI